jgi:hypothetical protein
MVNEIPIKLASLVTLYLLCKSWLHGGRVCLSNEHLHKFIGTSPRTGLSGPEYKYTATRQKTQFENDTHKRQVSLPKVEAQKSHEMLMRIWVHKKS